MPDIRFLVEMVKGVPVVAAPEEIGITNAGELRRALLESAAYGSGTFMVDLTRTQFCDTSGLHALVGARKRARAERRRPAARHTRRWRESRDDIARHDTGADGNEG